METFLILGRGHKKLVKRSKETEQADGRGKKNNKKMKDQTKASINKNWVHKELGYVMTLAGSTHRQNCSKKGCLGGWVNKKSV